ncbi:hypothetical protein RclHR1_00870010 [Rhizophagus clarus]|uniref:Paraneoplastic antigen Ma3-like n=1 Tax=Rhizophagus clarus TaxID=94130 RepID=A0A2Z6SNY0_9GLOM|nr:hypothetical protein RclHR1_00870010 [Rhizophagus clarus]GES87984.1 paraneoplastic antigen Ma3-like [Rhizophagus clarus]
MATEDHVKQYIRQAINLAFGVDLGQDIDQAPEHTVTHTLNQTVANLLPPINRAARIGELPLFHGGDQDPYEWESDFNVVWDANGYLEGNNQADKIRKAAACMRDDAANWFNEVAATITRWDANGRNGDGNFCVELRKRYASRTKQNQWAMELQNIKQQPGEKVGAYATRFKKLLNKVAPRDEDMAVRFKINYFIRGLNPLIAGRTYESNPNTLDGAITQARAIETGNNFLLQSIGQQSQVAENSSQNIINNKPRDEIEELTKQLEDLKIAKLEKEIRSLKGEVFGTCNKINTNGKPQFDYRKAKCFTCGKVGHTSKFCKESSNKRMNIYDYEEEYNEEEYYYEEELEEEDYQLYYQDTEFYPAERITRSKARMDPTQGVKIKKDDEIIIPRSEDVEMTERPKRVYVPKGKGKFLRKPSRFQQSNSKYDIVEDMKQMKPNINLAQLIEINPSLGTELAKATKRERVLKNQS